MSSSWENPEHLAESAIPVRLSRVSRHDGQGTVGADGFAGVGRVDRLHEALPGIAGFMG
jgi:hypothetical protein